MVQKMPINQGLQNLFFTVQITPVLRTLKSKI